MFDIVCYILENFLNNDLCKWRMLFFNFSFVKFWYMKKKLCVYYIDSNLNCFLLWIVSKYKGIGL